MARKKNIKNGTIVFNELSVNGNISTKSRIYTGSLMAEYENSYIAISGESISFSGGSNGFTDIRNTEDCLEISDSIRVYGVVRCANIET